MRLAKVCEYTQYGLLCCFVDSPVGSDRQLYIAGGKGVSDAVRIFNDIMKKNIKSILKESSFYPIYRIYYYHRELAKMKRDFWKCTEDDERKMDFYRIFICSGDLIFDVGANWEIGQ